MKYFSNGFLRTYKSFILKAFIFTFTFQSDYRLTLSWQYTRKLQKASLILLVLNVKVCNHFLYIIKLDDYKLLSHN